MSDDDVAPYEALAALIERELELVSRRDFDELALLKRSRAAIECTLPVTPPAAARLALQRCQLLHKRVEIELLRVREQLLVEMAQVRRAQRAANGYAAAASRPARPRHGITA
ncbi:MAG: hypothetical protein ABSH51_12820 [Solirubrobacteraceae bacterium]|jgi:hypothetical protein